MTKEPYHVCVASLQPAATLEQILEGGGSGQLTEGRRWTSVAQLQKQAELENRPLAVVFSEPHNHTELLYSAEIGKIKVHRTKQETSFAVTNLTPFADPRPSKVELFAHRSSSDNIERGKMPYIFCKTPPVLLEAKRPPSDSALKELTTRNVRSEMYELIHQENQRRVRSENELLFDVSTDFLQYLEEDGYAVDEEMIEEMRDDCRHRHSNRLASNLRYHYGLEIDGDEVAECETVESFLDLVKKKLAKS